MAAEEGGGSPAAGPTRGAKTSEAAGGATTSTVEPTRDPAGGEGAGAAKGVRVGSGGARPAMAEDSGAGGGGAKDSAPGDPKDPEGEARDSAASKVVEASRSFTAGSRPSRSRAALETGYFKPLPPTGRLQRLWQTFGLALGRRFALITRDDHIHLVVMAAVVGVASGAAAAVLLSWIDWADRLFHLPEESSALHGLVLVTVPVLGGLAAGGLRVLALRLSNEPLVVGAPGVIEAVSNRGGAIAASSIVTTGLGTGLTMGSGGSVGHEGPSVAIGAGVGSVVARFFGLRVRRHLAMVGAGCAAGLAAAFNAPLAGVIFTVELVFGSATVRTMGSLGVFLPLIVAAVAGTFTSYAIFGARTEFTLPPHATPNHVEIAFYLLLAVAAGVVGTLFGRAVLAAEGYFARDGLPQWLAPALGGLGVGLLALASSSPEILGAGRGTVAVALHGQLPWKAALLLIGLKIVASALTQGSGGFGGIFMPALFVGTCLGTVVGTFAGWVLGPSAQGVDAYALVGMGAMFGALMHAPLTPIVMIFELTRDYNIILPLMLACITASLVARRVGAEPFYRAALHHRGVHLQEEAEEDVMRRSRVRELMLSDVSVLHEDSGLDEIREAAIDSDVGTTFVVRADGVVVGYIDGRQLARRMLRGEIAAESRARDLMGRARLALLAPQDTLAGAMLAFARSELDVLPVVDRDRRLLGALRRGDVIARYSDEVLSKAEGDVELVPATGFHDEVALGQGVVLERVVVGRAWAGYSLAELDLRGRCGVWAVEWRRGERVLPLDPNVPLREGDTVALVGSREQILAARRLGGRAPARTLDPGGPEG